MKTFKILRFFILGLLFSFIACSNAFGNNENTDKNNKKTDSVKQTHNKQAGRTSINQNNEPLYPVEVDRKWGYINASGDIIIKPQFFKAYFFSDGLARVKTTRSNLYGIINKQGDMLIKPKPQMQDFHEGLIAAPSKEGKWGYLDSTGTWVIDPQYNSAYGFSDGLAIAYSKEGTKNGKFKAGFINKKGEWVIKPQFDKARNFSDGLAPVGSKSGMMEYDWGYINKKGEMVIPQKFKEATTFHQGLAAVSISSEKSFKEKWGYIDKTGAFVIQPHFKFASAFSDGLAPVQKEGGSLWAYINKKGKIVLDQLINEKEFTFAGPFRNGIARVALQGSFSKGWEGPTIRYAFTRNTKFAYINKKGKQIWPKANESDLPSVTPPRGYQVFHASWPSSKISVAYPEGWVAIDLNKFLNPVEGVSFMKNKKEAEKHKKEKTSIYSAEKVELGTKDNILISLRIYPKSASDLSPKEFLHQRYKGDDRHHAKKFFSSMSSWERRFSKYVTGRKLYFMLGTAESEDDFDVRGEIMAEKIQNRIITISSFAAHEFDKEKQRDMMTKMLKHFEMVTHATKE